jgi:uncharacterized Fe-S cluster-containing radical SAM superfamily enzyme
MKKYFVALIDDDPDDCEILETALRENYNDISLVSFDNGKAVLEDGSMVPKMLGCGFKKFAILIIAVDVKKFKIFHGVFYYKVRDSFKFEAYVKPFACYRISKRRQQA